MKTGIFHQVSRLYRCALIRRPFLVDAIQTGTIMGFGDLISQTVIEKKRFLDVDSKRLVRFAAIGFFMCGPVLRLWFGILHTHVDIYKRATGRNRAQAAIKKVVIDQGIFAPAYLLILLACVGLSQGKSWDKIKKDIQEKYFDVLQLNYCFWPIIQLFNFYWIPIEYQVLVGSMAALMWDTYLSWKMNRQNKDKF